MKTLNDVEISLVSGGYLCFADGCIQVSSEGIPMPYFNAIEYNLQQLMNGSITENQMFINIINANAIDYFPVYFQNLFKDHPYLLY